MAKIRKTTKKATAKARRVVSATGRSREAPHSPSPTAVAAEAMASGVVPLKAGPKRMESIPGHDEVLQIGDPDDRPIENAFVGDETPGGDTPTPDQNQVDPYGRAMGVSEEDSGALRTSSELLDRRDRHRVYQDVPEDHSKE